MKELDMYLNHLDISGKSKLTINDYKRQLEKWFEFQKIETLDDLKNIKSYDLETYDFMLKEKGLSINTRFSYTIPISGMYTYLVDREIVEKNPYKLSYKLENKNESEAFDINEIKKFLSHCKKRKDLAIFSLMFETGMRYCEVSNIKLEDIKHEDNTYFVTVVGKGNKKRTLGFSQITYNLINSYVDCDRNNIKDNNILFITQNGKPIQNNSLNYTFKSIAKKAGIKTDRKHLHMTRHSFCTMHIENGDSVKKVQTMMGHSNPEVTLKIYSHIKSKKMIDDMSNNSLIYK